MCFAIVFFAGLSPLLRCEYGFDAGPFANIPFDELERQLAALGVDVDGEMGELLSAVAADSALVPLEQLSAEDLAALSLDEVEARLRREGVDVAGYLSRALTLIRRTPADDRETLDSRRRRVAPHDAGAHRARRPSRLPRAVAASVIAVSIAGVVFTMVHEQGMLTAPGGERMNFDAASPGLVANQDESLTELARNRASDGRLPGGSLRWHADGDGDRRASLESAERAAPAKRSPRADKAERPAARAKVEAVTESLSEPAPTTVPRPSSHRAAAPAVPITLADRPAPASAPPGEREGESDSEARTAAPDSLAVAVAPAATEARGVQRALVGKEVTSGPGAGAVVGSTAQEDTMALQREPAGADPQGGELVTVDLVPGQTLAQALAPVALARQDRDALLALLPTDAVRAAQRLRLVLAGEHVVSAELERSGRHPVRVLRSGSGTLRRSP